LPTKMFFISSSVFQSCGLDSADLDVGQVVAGLSKGSLSIAGHHQRTCIGVSRAGEIYTENLPNKPLAHRNAGSYKPDHSHKLCI
jgi:hypothetical protein